MRKRFAILLMLIPLLMAACTPAETPTIEEAPATELAAPPATESAKPAPTAKPVSQGPAAPGMECTLVGDQEAAPAELVAIFGVTADDWAQGLDTAAVTIVEYSDFQ